MALPSTLRSVLVARVALFCGGLVLGCLVGELPAAGAEKEEQAAQGRELFVREWIPNDPRSLQGDGLGPAFNDTSCVACHNQAGMGGAGSAGKNAQLITVFSNRESGGASVGILELIFGGRRKPADKPAPRDPQVLLEEQREKLKRIHPGFLTARSLVLPRLSADDGYEAFREKMVGGSEFTSLGSVDRDDETQEPIPREASRTRELLKAEGQFGSALFRELGGGATIGDFTVIISERNTPALFGSGLLDAIPDDVLVAAAARRFDDHPRISGRIAKLKDGRVGRFGWKAQTARLNDFVLMACAVELGLEVPERPQLALPHKPDYKAPGLDLSLEQCNQLTAFVAALPAPRQRVPASAPERDYLLGGQKLFESVGCAHCHTPQLGEVSGLYSDLLLHDMGPELSDAGSYNGSTPNSTDEEELNRPVPSFSRNREATPEEEAKLIGATRQEWRTPPLWGLRDSAPYLHDGRAATLEQAIALHGGEASRSSQKFFKLPATERLQVSLFLRSLAAPE